MITNVFVIASFSLVLAISVDRFLAIYLHLRYQELVTHKRVFAAVISIWTLSVLYSPLDFYLKLKKPILVVINAIFVFCSIISGIIYSRIYLTARHHANQIQVLQIQVAENSQIESAARKRKSAISMFYVYLVFLVCYLPEYCVRVAMAHFIKSPQSLVGVYPRIKLCLLLWLGFFKTMKLLLSVRRDLSVRCREIILVLNRVQSSDFWR